MNRALYSMSWSFGSNNRSGDHIYKPTWPQIFEKLNELKARFGTVRLELNAHEEEGKTLTAYAESGYYMMFLNEVAGGKQILRGSYNPEAPAAMIEMPGDDWDARETFSDYDFIIITFRNFYEIGEVTSPRFFQ